MPETLEKDRVVLHDYRYDSHGKRTSRIIWNIWAATAIVVATVISCTCLSSCGDPSTDTVLKYLYKLENGL